MMKKQLLFLYFSFCIMPFCFSQNVGIGTATPLARLHVIDSSILFSASGLVPVTPDNTPVSGAGRRMMWYPGKASFRVGYIGSSQWDAANIGTYSIAAGFNTIASGHTAASLGNSNTASGSASIALGASTIASGSASVSMGSQSIASGYASFAMGENSIASSDYSFAGGINTKSKSYGGTVIGLYNDSTNAGSSTLINPVNRIFQVGNGAADIARSNALTILQNGNTGIGTTLPLAKLHVTDSAVLFSAPGNVVALPGNTPVSGQGRRMMWFPGKAAFRAGYVNNNQWDAANIGYYSVAMGYNTIAIGDYSTAFGSESNAQGFYSTVIGNNCFAFGDHSIAMGNFTTTQGDQSFVAGIFSQAAGLNSTAIGESAIATGDHSTAIGWSNSAMGNNSIAIGLNSTSLGVLSTSAGYNSGAYGNQSISMGSNTKSKSFAGLAVGIYNDSADAASTVAINPLNRLFQVGNGTANTARSNALTILHNGNIGIGELNPSVPLNFTATTGNKIALWGNGVNHYGFGIQASLLQVYTMDATNDIAFGYGSSASFNEHMRIKGNGNIGIGTLNPTSKLQVVGNICYSGTIGACSDIRYKHQFSPLDHSLNKVLSLKGMYYYWRQEEFPAMQFNSDRQIGFAAQEVELLFPELVITDSNGYKSVDYGRLTPVLVEAIKEQQRVIDELVKEVRELKKKVN